MLRGARCCFTIPIIIVGAIVVATSHPAEAFPVVFGFRGTVSSVFDGLHTLDPRIAPGAPFRGYYVFESTTPNTAPPGGEGEFGLYHHERPPAGVVVQVGGMRFFSHPRQPKFDVFANNDVGFVGADEYGFVSTRNLAFPAVRGDDLRIDWFASTFTRQVFSSADLPLDPPDLALLGGGEFEIYGECTPCASPTAFFRVTGPVTALSRIRFASPPTPATGDPFDFVRMLDAHATDRDGPPAVPEPLAFPWLLAITMPWWFRRRIGGARKSIGASPVAKRR